MAEMDEVKLGEAAPAKKKKTALIAAAVTVGALLACYLCLCAYGALSGRVFPNVTVGGADLSGMTSAQAVQTLAGQTGGEDALLTVELSCGSWRGELPAGSVQADLNAGAAAALACGRDNFFTQGFQLVRHLLGGRSDLPLPAALTPEGEQALEEQLDEADETIPGRAVQPTWEVQGEALLFTTGVPGRLLDRAQIRQDAVRAATDGLNARLAGDPDAAGSLTLAAEETQPEPLDFQAIYDEIHTEPADAWFDPETRSVQPHVTGVSFDVDAASARAEAAAEGQRLSVPLTITEPEVTAPELEAIMFSDVLGECTTNVGGTAARLGNVTLAAQKCDQYVMMPGDVFSYNTVVGPRTTAAGFLPAPAYVKGETVNEVGGGICQVSSTLYLACLRSNLEIVERQNHSYISDYITAGMDATVAYNAIDYQFRNDTEYPILIDARVVGRKLTIQILGTKTDDITVEMTYRILSTTPYEVVYEPDETVPVGTTKVKVTPYNGYKVVVYRNLYDGEGDLVESIQENVSNYRKRDRVILYNPADAESLGITTGGEATPSPSPDPSPSPTGTTPPVETAPPVETGAPVETPPAETSSPEPTAPVETAPAETAPPQPTAPVNTPAVSPAPAASGAPA